MQRLNSTTASNKKKCLPLIAFTAKNEIRHYYNSTTTNKQSILFIRTKHKMRVGSFMQPSEKVIAVHPMDTIGKAMELMLDHKVGAVVVLAEESHSVPGKTLCCHYLCLFI
jgi:CBS domain-containing protein